jgi:hygromycin-B 4-O-kinase
VPVPEILEVGIEVIPLPYMLQRKIDGEEAVDHPQRLEILRELGSYARLIHSIPTTGFGTVFNWSRNQLSKQKTWKEFLDNELEVQERIQFLQQHKLLSKEKSKKLNSLFTKIKRWKIAPCLNHCDLLLKNVIVNKAGKILAIIDWENCSSNIAPYWDLSIALHDLTLDGKHEFLEGYGLDVGEFSRMAYTLTAFNLLNYIPTLKKIIERQDTNRLELYRLRLNGSFDLFSL